MSTQPQEQTITGRASLDTVDPLFVERWSPRAFDGSAIPFEDLLTLFEAARWAPSAYNYQPWRFLFSTNGDEHWGLFLGTLMPNNQIWAGNASALVLVLSDTLVDQGKPEGPAPSRSHSFDAGASWASLALQAIQLGYHTRAMGGVDRDRAGAELSIPERYQIEIAIAIGRRAPVDSLPENLRARETPTDRRPLSDLVFEGPFAGAR